MNRRISMLWYVFFCLHVTINDCSPLVRISNHLSGRLWYKPSQSLSNLVGKHQNTNVGLADSRDQTNVVQFSNGDASSGTYSENLPLENGAQKLDMFLSDMDFPSANDIQSELQSKPASDSDILYDVHPVNFMSKALKMKQSLNHGIHLLLTGLHSKNAKLNKRQSTTAHEMEAKSAIVTDISDVSADRILQKVNNNLDLNLNNHSGNIISEVAISPKNPEPLQFAVKTDFQGQGHTKTNEILLTTGIFLVSLFSLGLIISIFGCCCKKNQSTEENKYVEDGKTCTDKTLKNSQAGTNQLSQIVNPSDIPTGDKDHDPVSLKDRIKALDTKLIMQPLHEKRRSYITPDIVPKPSSQQTPDLETKPKPSSQQTPDLETKPKPSAQQTPGLETKPKPSAQQTPGLETKPKPSAQQTPGLEIKPKPSAQQTPGLETKPKPSAQQTPGLETKETKLKLKDEINVVDGTSVQMGMSRQSKILVSADDDEPKEKPNSFGDKLIKINALDDVSDKMFDNLSDSISSQPQNNDVVIADTDEEDEFAEIQRGTTILKSFQRAKPPRNRSPATKAAKGNVRKPKTMNPENGKIQTDSNESKVVELASSTSKASPISQGAAVSKSNSLEKQNVEPTSRSKANSLDKAEAKVGIDKSLNIIDLESAMTKSITSIGSDTVSPMKRERNGKYVKNKDSPKSERTELPIMQLKSKEKEIISREKKVKESPVSRRKNRKDTSDNKSNNTVSTNLSVDKDMTRSVETDGANKNIFYLIDPTVKNRCKSVGNIMADHLKSGAYESSRSGFDIAEGPRGRKQMKEDHDAQGKRKKEESVSPVKRERTMSNPSRKSESSK